MTPFKPLPDEVAWGYRERIKRLLGSERIKALEIQNRAPGQSSRHITDVLASIAQMPAEQFIRLHTLVPIIRCVTGAAKAPPRWDECKWLDSLNFHSIKRAVLCPICCHEDLGWHQFTYWRRSHQIVGIVRCPKHGVPLRRCDRDRAMHSLPAEMLREAVEQDGAFASYADDPFANEYAETALALLDQPCPISVGQFLSRCREFVRRTNHPSSAITTSLPIDPMFPPTRHGWPRKLNNTLFPSAWRGWPHKPSAGSYVVKDLEPLVSMVVTRARCTLSEKSRTYLSAALLSGSDEHVDWFVSAGLGPNFRGWRADNEGMSRILVACLLSRKPGDAVRIFQGSIPSKSTRAVAGIH